MTTTKSFPYFTLVQVNADALMRPGDKTIPTLDVSVTVIRRENGWWDIDFTSPIMLRSDSVTGAINEDDVPPALIAELKDEAKAKYRRIEG